MKKIFKNKKIIISGVFIALVCFLFILKALLSYSIVENCFNKITGLKLGFTKPRTVVNKNLGVNFKADKINIYNSNKSITFVEINNPDILFRPLPLLFNKINFKKFNADNITINIKRNEKGEIDLIKESKLKNFEDFKKKKINFIRLNSNIENITLNFSDNYSTKSNTKLTLKDNEFNISKKHKSLKVSQNGFIESQLSDSNFNSKNNKDIIELNIFIQSKYPFKNVKKEDLKTDIELKGKDFYLLDELFKKYISADIENFKGGFNLDLKTLDSDFSQIIKLEAIEPKLYLTSKKIIAPYKKVVAQGVLKVDKELIKIDSFKINSNELNVEAKGEISKPLSKNKEINLETQIKDTQLNNFLYFIPDNAIYYRPKGIPALKKANFFAKLDGKIDLKLFPLNISGNLKASDIHIPNYPKPFVQNDVSAYFMKDKVRIYTRIYTPENQYVVIDGVSNLDDSLYGKYSIKSTEKIDLKYAALYLVPVQQIIGFNIGPVPIMDISGYGNIDIKTQGTLEDAQIFGQFSATNAEAKIEGLDAHLKHGKCKLVFDNRNLIFKEIKGKIDNADFLLTGTANTKGDVKLTTKINSISTNNALRIFKNSLLFKPYQKFVKNISAVSGSLAIEATLDGTIKDYENKNFLNDLVLNGILNFKNNKIILNNKLKAEKINGFVSFGNTQQGLLDVFINNSKINVKFSSKTPLSKISKGEKFDFKSNIKSDKFEFRDLYHEINKLCQNKNSQSKNLILALISNVNFYSKFDISSSGTLSTNNFNPANIKNSGYIIGLNSKLNENIKFLSGGIKIENDKLIFNNLAMDVLEGSVKIKGSINHILDKTPIGDAVATLDSISLNKINGYLPKVKITTSKIKNGQVQFKNDNLKLSSLSIEYDETPLFINAQIKDIYKNAKAEADFSTIFNEDASDSIFNPYLSYPIRVKGEIPVRGTFKGVSDNYDLTFVATIPKGADVYFSGANLGDITQKKEISSKLHITKDRAIVDNLTLIKYITNQNGKTNAIPSLKASGGLISKNNDLFYNNFRILSLSPINVRILNLVFKKSLLKQGNFECSLNLNDNVKNPTVVGKMQFQDLAIPLYDAIINNIKIDITNNFIEGTLLAQNKKSDIKASFKGQNKLTPPYLIHKLSIQSNNLDITDALNSTTKSVSKSDISADTIIAKPEDIIIENGNFEFKDVQYDKITAQNLKGNFNYKNNAINLDNIILDIAQGKIKAQATYNLLTTYLNLKANMENCNANILAQEFLNLQGQIYGLADGEITLKAKHLNTPDGIKNLKSKVEFSINNGKMPKLGSLEYLLRAGNLIKNGIMGLSLNNLIQVLTPYKTGEFEKISGKLTIEEADIKDLEILSQGKNLSLYLHGNYGILENFASIKIYGKLSQNISNALGSIGNASLNQFINSIVPKKDKTKDAQLLENLAKIPPIEIENPKPRYFMVKVLGDINKDNYIKNFTWE